MLSPIEILNKYFNYPEFRQGQIDIINSIYSGKDTFALMPTGGGKSICYQIPAIAFQGTSIIISPLISLMKDQVDTLVSKGVNAAYINSTLSTEEQNLTLHKLKSNEIKILYLAPERIESKSFIESIRNIHIPFLAIDEAHCISEWGHDFRPSYRKVSLLREIFPNAITGAFTATATNDVKDDIIKSLNLRTPNVYFYGFNRKNLSYKVVESKNKNEDVLKLVKNINGSAIIYAGSRKRVEECYNYLKGKINKISYYHAGLNEQFRKNQQDKFLSNESNIIVATNAFGLGIDKADVRKIIHIDLTATIEAYYQEAGRAGRDGKEAECILLYNNSDRGLQDYFIKMSYPLYDDIVKVYNYLYNQTNTKTGEFAKNPFYGNKNDVAFNTKLETYKVENILNLFENNEIISSGKASNWAYVKINPDRERVKEYYNATKEEFRKVLEAFLRNINASETSKHTIIYFDDIIRKYNLDKEQLDNAIRSFQYNEIIDFRGYRPRESITLLLARYEESRIPINFEDLIKRKSQANAKLDLVEEFAKTKQCKRNFILKYFGEEINENCNNCSSCLNKSTTSDEVLKLISSKIQTLYEETRNQYNKTITWNILKGSNSKDVLAKNFQFLKSYGSLKDVRKSDFDVVWFNLSNSQNVKKSINKTSIANDVIMLVNSKKNLEEIIRQTNLKKQSLLDLIIENKSVVNLDSLFNNIDLDFIKKSIIKNKTSIRDIQLLSNYKLEFIEAKFILDFYN